MAVRFKKLKPSIEKDSLKFDLISFVDFCLTRVANKFCPWNHCQLVINWLVNAADIFEASNTNVAQPTQSYLFRAIVHDLEQMFLRPITSYSRLQSSISNFSLDLHRLTQEVHQRKITGIEVVIIVLMVSEPLAQNLNGCLGLTSFISILKAILLHEWC